MINKILILTANPENTSSLRLHEEVREIEHGLQRAKKRDNFVLQAEWAVRPRDIQRAMLDVDPQIVHFSGHGTGDEGLVFEDETGQTKLVDGEALAGLFKLFADRIECVVLNGCYSQTQAEAIAQQVDYVIGMKKAIGDKAAIEFAVG
ncbi:MAG: CHAT domain-containing protein, partial [Cyanobacteria bacterium J06635_10]